MSFLLSNSISLALDFHFVLLVLNRLKEIEEITDERPHLGQDQIKELKALVDVWRKDDKWKTSQQVKMDRKKIFEIKWMTRTTVFMDKYHRMVRKKAGTRQNEYMQKKKEVRTLKARRKPM